MIKETKIKIFENKQIHSLWDEKHEKWYISISEIVESLSPVAHQRCYLNDFTTPLKPASGELITNCSLELVLKASSSEITKEKEKEKESKKSDKNKKVTKLGDSIAAARKKLESATGKKIFRLNSKKLNSMRK
jgi:hypothetical protein